MAGQSKKVALSFKPWALMGVALYLSSTSISFADDASLQRQIEELQRALLSQQNQIHQLEQDIAASRGELEQTKYLLNRQNASTANTSALNNLNTGANSTANKGTTTTPTSNAASSSSQTRPNTPVTALGNDNRVQNQNDLNNANTAANNSSSSNTGSSSTSSSANNNVLLQGVSDAAQQDYNQAYSYVQQNNLSAAELAFKQYLDKYPDNTLTPNAYYWLGQVQYSQTNYQDARLSFLNVARFQGSQKRPDAIYKLGMISKYLGDNEKAKLFFQLVKQEYPNDAAANLASREIERL